MIQVSGSSNILIFYIQDNVWNVNYVLSPTATLDSFDAWIYFFVIFVKGCDASSSSKKNNICQNKWEKNHVTCKLNLKIVIYCSQSTPKIVKQRFFLWWNGEAETWWHNADLSIRIRLSCILALRFDMHDVCFFYHQRIYYKSLQARQELYKYVLP